ncbi:MULTISPECIES: hypothetical protein [unclassified Pseudomonas]|uniref:hypothetical protein n=1 Tax=unclassified Pseudomonas TaxID=196821 RepID=UPI0035BFFAFD
MHANGASGFVDVVADKANIGVTVLVSRSINCHSLHHDQRVSRNLIGREGLVQALTKGVRALTIGAGVNPGTLRHTQESCLLSATNNTTSRTQVGCTKASQGEAYIAQIDVIGGIETRDQKLLFIDGFDGQLRQLELRRYALLLEGLAVLLLTAVGEPKLYGGL